MHMQGLLPAAAIPLSAPPDPARFPPEVRAKVDYDPGSGTLHVKQPLNRDETIALRDSLGTLTDRQAVEDFWQASRPVGTAAKRLDQYAEPVRVPQLVVRDGDRTYLFEPAELDEFAWNLDRCDPKLNEAGFSVELNVGDRVALDLTDRGGVRIGGVAEVIVRQLSFLPEDEQWDKGKLAGWLDEELHRGGAFDGLTARESGAWILRAIDYLLSERGASLPVLVRKRHELAGVLIPRVAEHGRRQVRAVADMLIAGLSARRLETSMTLASILAEHDYCPYRRYEGGFYSFPKHAFDLIGDMNGDEAACAKKIEDHPNVKRWLRNLDPTIGVGGASLPLSPGHFYFDFIAELADGRTAIVEYKNATLARAEQHKKDVGVLWAARSEGRCVFALVVERDWAVIGPALAVQT